MANMCLFSICGVFLSEAWSEISEEFWAEDALGQEVFSDMLFRTGLTQTKALRKLHLLAQGDREVWFALHIRNWLVNHWLSLWIRSEYVSRVDESALIMKKFLTPHLCSQESGKVSEVNEKCSPDTLAAKPWWTFPKPPVRLSTSLLPFSWPAWSFRAMCLASKPQGMPFPTASDLVREDSLSSLWFPYSP